MVPLLLVGPFVFSVVCLWSLSCCALRFGLQHEGLTNVNTRKRMFYPLDIATDTVQRTRLRTPLILRTIAPQPSTMLQTGIRMRKFIK